MTYLFRSLNRKMVAFLILVLGTSLATSSFLSIRSETAHNLRLARERVQSYAGALQANMFRVMVEGKCEEIPVVLRTLTSQEEFRMARIFSPGGKVIESTEDREKGKLFDISDLLEKENQGGILIRSPEGEKILRVLSPFYNEPKCARCHREGGKVRAYLAVDLSLSSFEHQLESHNGIHFVSDFCVLLMICGSMLFFFSRFVNGPIIEVSRKISQLEKGNFGVQVPVKTQDEVGRLASRFNFMVKRLREMREREEEQHNLLGRKVDLSQRQLEEANEQLRQKIDELDKIRSFNESILQNLYGGIVSYTKEGTITFINRPGAKLLGWGESEVLGRSIDDVLGNGGREPSFFRKRLDGEGDLFSETEVLKKGGERIPIEVFLSDLRGIGGNIAGVTGIFRDITEKKEIEARMHRIDKLASLGQLASGIAHEIKNPLAGIGSAIQVLSSSIQGNDSRKKVFNEILNQIHRLDGTIRNMLSFARPGQLKLASADPNEVIEAVIFLVRQQVKKQNIETRFDVGKDLPKVMIDPQQIQQAVLNVVLNAVEAMPSGGMLTISAREKACIDPSKRESPYLSIVVSDTGAGIAETTMAQIFNPFYTTKPAGTGLGLSITQRIIEEHHGKIDIQSEAGKGTSFIIDLPV
jgi:PAS domain S-box-containing protein